MSDCKLYLISPPEIDDIDKFTDELSAVMEACEIAAFQLRIKNASDDKICTIAEKLMPIVHRNECAFLINDSPTLAQKVGADGVHIGQEDTPYSEARKILGDKAIIGVTCHNSKHLAMVAAEKGADYVAFGAFYETSTKQAKASAEPELLTWWQDIFNAPCVAIGGITPDNCVPLIRAGADFIAVSSGIWQHSQGAVSAAELFLSKLNGTD